MNGMITTNENYCLDDVIPALKVYTTGKVVEKVTCKEKYELSGSRDLAEMVLYQGARGLCPQTMRRESVSGSLPLSKR